MRNLSPPTRKEEASALSDEPDVTTITSFTIDQCEEFVKQGKMRRMFVECPSCKTPVKVLGHYQLVETCETVGPAPKGGIYG